MKQHHHAPHTRGAKHKSSFGDDFWSDPVGNAVNAAGQIITHPGDDINTGWTIATHPADDVSTIVNVGPDFFVQQMKGAWRFTGNTGAWLGKGFSDFAKTSIAQTLFSALTTVLYMTFAPIVGPLALLVFAFPGLAKGDDFGTAWLQGFAGQAQKAAKALTGGAVNIDVLPPEVQDQVAQVTQAIGDNSGQAMKFLTDPNVSNVLQQAGLPDPAHITPEQLAAKLGIREDAAYAALSGYLRDPNLLQLFTGSTFDPKTGKRIPPKTTQSVTGAGAASRLRAPSAMQLIGINAKLTAWQKIGQGIISKNASAQAARDVKKTPDYQKGFEVGTGIVNQEGTNGVDLATTRGNLKFGDQQLGYDAAIAYQRGALKTVGRVFGNPQATAGAFLTHGLNQVQAPKPVVQAIMGAVASNPPVAQGAAQALQVIAAAAPKPGAVAQKSWWETFLGWFGL